MNKKNAASKVQTKRTLAAACIVFIYNEKYFMTEIQLQLVSDSSEGDEQG